MSKARFLSVRHMGHSGQKVSKTTAPFENKNPCVALPDPQATTTTAMKFNTLAFVLALTSVAYALPEGQVDAATSVAQAAADSCGAAGSCHGFGGEDLCNDRCKRCSGPSGSYHRGACCGFFDQACCCYYD